MSEKRNKRHVAQLHESPAWNNQVTTELTANSGSLCQPQDFVPEKKNFCESSLLPAVDFAATLTFLICGYFIIWNLSQLKG